MEDGRKSKYENKSKVRHVLPQKHIVFEVPIVDSEIPGNSKLIIPQNSYALLLFATR